MTEMTFSQMKTITGGHPCFWWGVAVGLAIASLEPVLIAITLEGAMAEGCIN